MQKRVTSAKQKRQKLINERLAHRSVQGPAAQASEVTIVTKEASAFRGAIWYDPRTLQTSYKERETLAEITKKKVSVFRPLERQLHADFRRSDFQYRDIIQMPVRPKWHAKMSKKEVEKNEDAYFTKYVDAIFAKYESDRLNHFEQNLGVWRQLWRVCERSDLLVLVADARYPLFHFPPSLYNYITTVVKKPFVLALNKIDMISKALLLRWLRFFRSAYPLVTIIPFTSYPQAGSITFDELEEFAAKKRKPMPKTKPVPAGVDALCATWQHLVDALPPRTVADSTDDAKQGAHDSDGDDSENDDSSSHNAEQRDAAERKRVAFASSKKAAAAKPTTGRKRSDDGDDDVADAAVGSADFDPDSDGAGDDTRDIDDESGNAFAMLHESDDENLDAASDSVEEVEDSDQTVGNAMVSSAAARVSSPQNETKSQDIGQNVDGAITTPADIVAVSSFSVPSTAKKAGDQNGAVFTQSAWVAQSHLTTGEAVKSKPSAEELVPRTAKDKERALIYQLRMKKQKKRDPMVTIGLIGHPNVGKSTIINALCGKFKVGVSATPGHTKHLQTVALNDKVQLCDCPGLVFPAVDMPKSLQVLCALYPLPQLREPYTVIQYLAERVRLEEIYNLKPYRKAPAEARAAAEAQVERELGLIQADDSDHKRRAAPVAKSTQAQKGKAMDQAYPYRNHPWSAGEILEAYANVKNYRVAQGELDTFRAAHDMIGDVLTGAIVLYFEPPELSTGADTTTAAAAPATAR